MSTHVQLLESLRRAYPDVEAEELDGRIVLKASLSTVPGLAIALTTQYGCEFATLVVEEIEKEQYAARYFFYIRGESSETSPAVLFEIATTTGNRELPAISDRVHAADWEEREAEDMFGIHVSGHPFLGDFVLHDNDFPEGVGPMRRGFDAHHKVESPGLGGDWKPRRILEESGALVFPVGPVWGDYHESGLWLLETPGEQIRQAHSRLFYKYRGVEKIAEGQPPERALLLAERFSGSAAVAHALAYCQALERIADCTVPVRAQMLRIMFAEFERVRYHAAAIAELAGSTGLAVGKAMAQEIEEALLRLAGEVCGHRYLFGLIAPGGLAWQPTTEALRYLEREVALVQVRLNQFENWLVNSSSFLDRIEEMGVLTPELAEVYGTVGPVGRASGRRLDLRRHLPYGGYDAVPFDMPCEMEGDGFARMRVFFAETRASSRVLAACLADLPEGPAMAECQVRAGSALGWAEAPTGGAFHWLQVNHAGSIGRWRISTAGLRNWHAFHRAVEGAAFQDFPIILASFGLSIAENDR